MKRSEQDLRDAGTEVMYLMIFAVHRRYNFDNRHVFILSISIIILMGGFDLSVS